MNKNQGFKTKREIVRVAGKLKEIVTVKDDKGNIIQKIISPVMIEFYFRDLMQVIVGATLLAIPVAFTEETWNLGATLPLRNILAILGISIFFISSFVYYNFYKGRMKGHLNEFIKRSVSTYVVSAIVVSILLFLIQRAPFGTDPVLTFKRIVLVSFPASMSAAVADMIK